MGCGCTGSASATNIPGHLPSSTRPGSWVWRWTRPDGMARDFLSSTEAYGARSAQGGDVNQVRID